MPSGRAVSATQLAPGLVALELRGKTVVINGISDAGPAFLLVAAGEAGKGEIEHQEQRQAIAEHRAINRGPPLSDRSAISSDIDENPFLEQGLFGFPGRIAKHKRSGKETFSRSFLPTT